MHTHRWAQKLTEIQASNAFEAGLQFRVGTLLLAASKLGKLDIIKGIVSLSGLEIRFYSQNLTYFIHYNYNSFTLRKRYSGTSLNGGNCPDQKGFAIKGDFRQASHTMQKIQFSDFKLWSGLKACYKRKNGPKEKLSLAVDILVHTCLSPENQVFYIVTLYLIC